VGARTAGELIPGSICVITRRPQADVVISRSNITINSEIATVAALLRNEMVWNRRSVYRIPQEPALRAKWLVIRREGSAPARKIISDTSSGHLSGMTAGDCAAIIGRLSFEQEEKR
jgi:hypothetical protein